MTRNPHNMPAHRPYPWHCHECRQKTVQPVREKRSLDAKYDGRMYTLEIPDFPVNRCTNCGAASRDVESDEAISRALRDHLGLLHPQEIRANREALGLTQEQLGDALACAAESLSRWENGMIVQSRAYDRALRAYFHLPELRRFFEMLPANVTWGRTVVRDTLVAASPDIWGEVRTWVSSCDDVGGHVQQLQSNKSQWWVGPAQPSQNLPPISPSTYAEAA